NAIRLSLFMVYPRLVFFLIQQDTPFLLLYSYTTNKHSSKEVNIHDGIDSTLMILQSRLKEVAGHPGIKVIKQYGDLPLVECYAGQLNQVFMNILSNAIDAVDELTKKCSCEQLQQNPLTIAVVTEKIDDRYIQIRISDNGGGISEQVQQRLFEPFFTTKPIGKGTGLGLSISYQVVVEKHGGQLTCHSEPGKGTQFVIELPLKLNKLVPA
ncbi:HAMP domain-containing histidine kinase, partial [Leptolyngbya sp. PL-A3]|uniref:sensor histidine kinase n=1 Tax=Leptolyngbya sp. PL-A3 TaxID=2933911 RepID=UPI003299C1AD